MTRERTVGTCPGAAPELLLNYEQAAAFLNTTKRHVRWLWERRKIAAYKIGRKVRFKEEDLRTWAEAQRVDPIQ